MIAMNTVIFSIGVLVVSVVGGLIAYYVVDTADKQQRKQRLDQFLNYLIQFVLYLWAAKILLQLSRVVQDPISVLAYPANSMHFFVATIFILVHVWIKFRKSMKETLFLLQTSSFVLIVALFLYEIIHMITDAAAQIDLVTIVLGALVIIYVALYEKYDKNIVGISVSGTFLLFISIIAFSRSYFVLFNFMIAPYYFVLLFILLAVYTYFIYKKV